MPEVGKKQAAGGESQQKRCHSRARTRLKGSRALAQQRQDTKTQATDLEDQIPELKAKSQSKNRSGFSRSAQKVDKRGQWKKVAEGDMEEAEKEQSRELRHSEINGRVWSGLKSWAYANNADKNVMLTGQLK
ncbi:hypothetical protein DFH08DRAFT_813346 [Mycena albidolilacea]|uniref:Uncharacterized protein n=1 Tax=Mycena albidolilacea TaxID=1033008 RepID=A0AAD7EMK0_9AGAR|nr:hypothetical protein DFH08DRAFT_813346 [Mycena albidolilacea]